MKIFVTGATGVIGRRFIDGRVRGGDVVVALSRNAARAQSTLPGEGVEVVEGDPARPGAWQDSVDGCDAVLHLAGESLTSGRWTRELQQRFIDSRVDGTHQVTEAIRMASTRPAVLISGSAVGWYGPVDHPAATEHDPAASGDFLAGLCAAWEAAATPARELGVRTVFLRTGLVMDPVGGLLERVLPIFRKGLGGRLGHGRQYMPWIHWQDEVRLIEWAIENTAIDGPLNACAPEPVTNRVWTKTLAKALRRPAWFPVPRFALRLALGRFAKYATMSQNIIPAKAFEAGFEFQFPTIDVACRDLVTDSTPVSPPRSLAFSGEAAPKPAAPVAHTTPAAHVRHVAITTPDAAPSRPPELVAVSLDGGLLHNGKLTDGTIHACRAVMQTGVPVILATGRSPRAAQPVLQALGLQSPTIAFHGALIWNVQHRDVMWQSNIDTSTAHELIDAIRAAAPDTLMSVDTATGWFTDRVRSGGLDLSDHLEPDGVGPLTTFLGPDVIHLSVLPPIASQAAVRQVVSDFLRRGMISRFERSGGLMQIGAPGIDKAIALQRLARTLEIDRAAVMAVGGGLHDTGMVEWAGFGVALEDAPERVHAVADAIAPGREQSGVARALHRHVLFAAGRAAGNQAEARD